MENNVRVSGGVKVLSVVLGALIGAFMWRCRGEGGFGSSWGLYSVGLMLLLLIWNVYGKRKRMKFELIPLGAFLMGLGVTGYATVMDQMCGVIWSDLPYRGEQVYVPINPYHGLLIFAVMGFTFVPFFSFFVGSLFSEKRYKLKHYIITAVIFFGVSYIAKATVAHPLLKAINPETVSNALLGLKDSGYDYPSAMSAYMHHFAQRKWTQEIPFFENYYMCIEHISDVFGIIGILVYARVFLKDKITAGVSLAINCLTCIGTTGFCLLLFSSGFDTGLMAKVNVPAFLKYGGGWSIWEYATGFSVGLATMLVLALLSGKKTEQNKEDNRPFMAEKIPSFILNTFLTVFILALTPFRAIGMRIGSLLENQGILEDKSPTGDIIMIAGTVLLSAFFIYTLVKNILKGSSTPLGVSPVGFAEVTLPSYLAMCAVAYFVLGHGPVFHLPVHEITGFSTFVSVMTNEHWAEFSIMTVTLILIIVFYALMKKLQKKQGWK